METRGFILRLGRNLYTLGMPDTLASQITEGDEKRLRQPIDVLQMSITPDGFLFVTANSAGKGRSELKYEPQHFAEFIQDIGKAGVQLATLLKLETAGAEQIWQAFYRWLNHKQADDFEQRIKAGESTFEEVRSIRKEVFDVPKFQSFFAESFKTGNIPTGKKGKRRTYSRSAEELYALACRIYRETPGLSFEAACYMATEQRPELVPSTWKADPDGNLKRDAARYWDKSPYSQLSYRMARDR